MTNCSHCIRSKIHLIPLSNDTTFHLGLYIETQYWEPAVLWNTFASRTCSFRKCDFARESQQKNIFVYVCFFACILPICQKMIEGCIVAKLVLGKFINWSKLTDGMGVWCRISKDLNRKRCSKFVASKLDKSNPLLYTIYTFLSAA